MILLTNILVSYPSDIATLCNRFIIGKKLGTQVISTILLLILVVFMFAFTYFLQDSQKDIQLIVSLFGNIDHPLLNVLNSSYWFRLEKPVYSIGVLFYIALIFGFSYFYTNITVNPDDIANKIKTSGGNISGIRAGKPTADYLRKQMKYMTAIGAGALTIIAMIPIILAGIWGISSISFLGTSIIITVGVISETKKTLEMELKKDKYHYIAKKGGIFHG